MTCLAGDVVSALRFARACCFVRKGRDCKGVTSVRITRLKFDICALGFSVPLDARHREVHFGLLAENVFGVGLRETEKAPPGQRGLVSQQQSGRPWSPVATALSLRTGPIDNANSCQSIARKGRFQQKP